MKFDHFSAAHSLDGQPTLHPSSVIYFNHTAKMQYRGTNLWRRNPMLTFLNRVTTMNLTAHLALVVGLSACGSDASDHSRSPELSSMVDAPPGSASSSRASQRTPGDPAPRVSAVAATDPPPRPRTKETCESCLGLWAVHGIEETETCICKTNDEGNVCFDGEGCQGECVLDGDPEFHVMQAGDPPLGYYAGRCAGYDTTFGCFWRIGNDVERRLPLSAEEAGEFVCVD
jgi:hypothetical protein